jgi:hypothetical protein
MAVSRVGVAPIRFFARRSEGEEKKTTTSETDKKIFNRTD